MRFKRDVYHVFLSIHPVSGIALVEPSARGRCGRHCALRLGGGWRGWLCGFVLQKPLFGVVTGVGDRGRWVCEMAVRAPFVGLFLERAPWVCFVKTVFLTAPSGLVINDHRQSRWYEEGP